MRQIGIWEQQEGLAEWVSYRTAHIPRQHALIRACSHPEGLSGVLLDLLIISPQAAGGGVEKLRCRTVLVPGDRSPAFHDLTADLMVSYGIDPRNTLTLSSLEEDRAAIAVQRDFPALDGALIEQQEIIFPCRESTNPALLLAQAGAALLLGLPIEPAADLGPLPQSAAHYAS